MRACACWETLHILVRRTEGAHDAISTSSPRSSAAKLNRISWCYLSEFLFMHARAHVFIIDCSSVTGELELSSRWIVVELTFICAHHRYVFRVCCLACGRPSAVPAPATCRALCLLTSAGRVRTHVALTRPALRWTQGTVCAAQNRLPKA